VTLDEWTREQVNNMRDIGNIRSNEIYNPDESKHPPPAATGVDERDSELAKYIRRKYELGAFKRAAPKELATSNAITSRALARDVRSGHSHNDALSPLRADDQPRRERDLPALPPTAGRRPSRNISGNGPLWSGLASQNTGASNTSQNSAGSGGSAPSSAAPTKPVFPTRSNTAPVFTGATAGPTVAALLRPKGSPPPPRTTSANANTTASAPAKNNLLVDVEGSSSSTRPLQLNGFPTVPAWQPQQQGPASPYALGQQAFFTPSPGNPFQQPVQQSFLQQPMQPTMGVSPTGLSPMAVPNGMGMNMNGMNGMTTGMPGMAGMGMSPGGMGMSPSAMNNGGMGLVSPLGSMPMAPHMGMNMNPHMGMGMGVGVPVQQPNPWASYGA